MNINVKKLVKQTSKEQYEKITAILQEATEGIKALPESTNNGLLIDAMLHAQNASEHLRRYFQMKGEEKC